MLWSTLLRAVNSFADVPCAAGLLYGNQSTAQPTKWDTLVIQIGAHSSTQKDMAAFVHSLLELIVLPFPGRRLWVEPLPQHFNLPPEHFNGNRTRITFATNGIKQAGRCPSITRESIEEQQRTRVDVVHRALTHSRGRASGTNERGSSVCLVHAFDELVPLHWDHPHARDSGDCTHFGQAGYTRVWQSILRTAAGVNTTRECAVWAHCNVTGVSRLYCM
jgi:hypothetical protein